MILSELSCVGVGRVTVALDRLRKGVLSAGDGGHVRRRLRGRSRDGIDAGLCLLLVFSELSCVGVSCFAVALDVLRESVLPSGDSVHAGLYLLPLLVQSGCLREDRLVSGPDASLEVCVAVVEGEDVHRRLARHRHQDVLAVAKRLLTVLDPGHAIVDCLAMLRERSLQRVLRERDAGQVRIGPLDHLGGLVDLGGQGPLILFNRGRPSNHRVAGCLDARLESRLPLGHAANVVGGPARAVVETGHPGLHGLLERGLSVVQCEHGQRRLARGRGQGIDLGAERLLSVEESGHRRDDGVLVGLHRLAGGHLLGSHRGECRTGICSGPVRFPVQGVDAGLQNPLRVRHGDEPAGGLLMVAVEGFLHRGLGGRYGGDRPGGLICRGEQSLDARLMILLMKFQNVEFVRDGLRAALQVVPHGEQVVRESLLARVQRGQTLRDQLVVVLRLGRKGVLFAGDRREVLCQSRVGLLQPGDAGLDALLVADHGGHLALQFPLIGLHCVVESRVLLRQGGQVGRCVVRGILHLRHAIVQ